jgi:hypothetical protein
MKEDKERGALSFSLQALLTSKVDKLAPDQQRVLKVQKHYCYLLFISLFLVVLLCLFSCVIVFVCGNF